MRITSLLLSITVCLAIAGGFIAGYYMGESAGREAGADVAFSMDAARSAEAFAFASSIRQALRDSKPAQAELAAIRYAAMMAPKLLACQSSPDCTASAGRTMPTKAQLEEVVAAHRAMRTRQ
jgi:hypothetical protein